MTTLNTFESLPKLPRDQGGPVFKEPWQAQAFALAVKLSEAGWAIHDEVAPLAQFHDGAQR